MIQVYLNHCSMGIHCSVLLDFLYVWKMSLKSLLKKQRSIEMIMLFLFLVLLKWWRALISHCWVNLTFLERVQLHCQGLDFSGDPLIQGANVVFGIFMEEIDMWFSSCDNWAKLQWHHCLDHLGWVRPWSSAFSALLGGVWYLCYFFLKCFWLSTV